ncbi:lipoprotein 17-related variable surface protein [Mycoplasma seminis]|uniref:Lipoprotein 17-related variable surface protein n=1 Tax=Mycoplasma seminis TaxID=512749 RepID=A0ABY9HBU9_9MOLU|nr:lipoprotein 17-related variable surface protein [Mycoplasma seminis]WLP85158.1 lipoprotein 17-related variable surface protein [Mycoplasma seminis]
MKKFKTLLLSLAGASALALPIAAVSCSQETEASVKEKMEKTTVKATLAQGVDKANTLASTIQASQITLDGFDKKIFKVTMGTLAGNDTTGILTIPYEIQSIKFANVKASKSVQIDGFKTTPAATEQPGDGKDNKQPADGKEGEKPAAGEKQESDVLTALKAELNKANIDLNINSDQLENKASTNASAYSELLSKATVSGYDAEKYTASITSTTCDNSAGAIKFNVEMVSKADVNVKDSKEISVSGFKPTSQQEVDALKPLTLEDLHLTTDAKIIDSLFGILAKNKNPFIRFYHGTRKLSVSINRKYVDLSTEPIVQDGLQLSSEKSIFYKKDPSVKFVNPSANLYVTNVNPETLSFTMSYRVVSVNKETKPWQYTFSQPYTLDVKFTKATPANTTDNSNGASGEETEAKPAA